MSQHTFEPSVASELQIESNATVLIITISITSLGVTIDVYRYICIHTSKVFLGVHKSKLCSCTAQRFLYEISSSNVLPEWKKVQETVWQLVEHDNLAGTTQLMKSAGE